jgi:hypothetical protein
MGGDGFVRSALHPGSVVGRDDPGLAIFIVSLAFNLLGDGLRDVLDPRQKR